MANKNFIVQNGLQVGPLTIDAATGSISTTGTVDISGGLAVSTISKNDSSISINDTGTGSNISINIDGVTEHVLTSTLTTLNGNLKVNDVGYLQVPAGTNAQRPGSPANGMMRYNSSITSFEGYYAGAWSSLGGVKSVDGKAYITAEASAGAGDDVIRVYAGDSGTSTQVAWASTSNVSILPSTETTAAGTGALQVAGGASIGGNAYVANNLYIGSTAFSKNLTTPTIIAVDNGSNYAQIGMINTSGNGSADFAAYADNGTDAAGWVDMGIAGSTFNDGNYTITKPNDGYLITRPFSNSYGGNLVIGTSEVGSYNDIVIGVGSFAAASEVARFHGNVSNNGTFTIKYPTVSSSTTTGALVVTGGIASGGDLRVAGNIYAASLNTVSSSQLTVTAPLVYLQADAYPYTFDIGMYSHFVGGPANTYTHTGAVRSYQNNYWGFFSNVKQEPSGSVNWTDSGLIWDTIKAGALIIANSTSSTTTTTGALQVAGGVGIVKSVTIGGDGGTAITHTGNIVPSGNLSYNLGSSTAWYNTFYGVSTQAKYADLAENYQADKSCPPGTVVMFGGDAEVTVADAETTRVAGVVSTNPAHLMNGGLTGSNVVALALQGRVPCNVIGPVKKGDMMVSAGFGYAKASADPKVGQVIGKALSDFTGAKGQIEVVVGRV